MTTSKNAVRKAGGLVGLAMLVRLASQAMALLLVLVAGRVLTIEEFGLFALSMIALNLSSATLYSGIYDYVLKEPEFERDRSTAFSLHVSICSLFAVLILAVAGIVQLASGASDLALYIASTAGIPLLLLFSCWQEAELLRKGDVKVYYWIILVSESVGFFVAVALLFSGVGIFSLIIGRYLSSFMLAAALSIKGTSVPKFGWVTKQARRIWTYSAGLYGSSLMTFFSGYSADILIGGVLNARSVGLFRMGTRMTTATYDIGAQATRIFAWQALGRKARENQITDPLWLKIYGMFLMFVVIVAGSMAILAEPMTLLILGDHWVDMIPVLQIISVLYMIRAIDLVSMVQLSAAGDTVFIFKTKLLQLTLLLVSIMVAVRYGAVAVAWSLYPSALVIFGVYLHRLLKTTDTTLRKFVAELAPIIFCSLATLAAVAFANSVFAFQSNLMQLLAPVLCGAAVLIALLAVPMRKWAQDTLHEVSVAILPAGG